MSKKEARVLEMHGKQSFLTFSQKELFLLKMHSFTTGSRKNLEKSVTLFFLLKTAVSKTEINSTWNETLIKNHCIFQHFFL
jgi:hypothetical protein